MISKARKKGFTLIELLVVIAIIGVLATVVLASLNRARDRSADTARIATTREIEKALNLYYSNNGRYPIIGEASVIQPRPHSRFTLIPKALAQPIDGGDGTPNNAIESALYPQYLPRLPEGDGRAYYYESDGQTYCLATRLEVTQVTERNEACISGGSDTSMIDVFSASVLLVLPDEGYDEFLLVYSVGNL